MSNIYDVNNVNNADEIIPRLWLGNVRASLDEEFIKDKGINVVFNCTKNLGFSPSIPIKYKVPLDDNLEEQEIRNMELWSNEIAFQIMSEYLSGKIILVHCMAGMQRSAASVALFLIAFLKLKGKDAIDYIKSKRPIAFFQNANFGRAIDYFDRKFHSEILNVVSQTEVNTKVD